MQAKSQIMLDFASINYNRGMRHRAIVECFWGNKAQRFGLVLLAVAATDLLADAAR
jgi:hypothetical protein